MVMEEKEFIKKSENMFSITQQCLIDMARTADESREALFTLGSSLSKKGIVSSLVAALVFIVCLMTGLLVFGWSTVGLILLGVASPYTYYFLKFKREGSAIVAYSKAKIHEIRDAAVKELENETESTS